VTGGRVTVGAGGEWPHRRQGQAGARRPRFPRHGPGGIFSELWNKDAGTPLSNTNHASGFDCTGVTDGDQLMDKIIIHVLCLKEGFVISALRVSRFKNKNITHVALLKDDFVILILHLEK